MGVVTGSRRGSRDGTAVGLAGDPRVQAVIDRAPALSAEHVEQLRHLLPATPVTSSRDSDAA